jgi:hypothetical protein
MEGNTFPELDYAIRITFGIIHGVLLTLSSFVICLYIPSLSRILFALLGCIVAPVISFILTLFCSASVEYVSKSTITPEHILSSAWIPPLGIFCMNLILLPLEMMPSIGTVHGPYTSVVATSIFMNFLLSIVLQVYAARNVQTKSAGLSSPT